MAIRPTLRTRNNRTEDKKADINDIMFLIYMGTTISNIFEMFKHNECKSKEKEGYLITVTRSIKSFLISLFIKGMHKKRSSMISPCLYCLFENNISYLTYPELLWTAGQYQLALKFCEETDESASLYNLILALASSKYTRKKIEEILLPIKDKSEEAIKNLIKFGLIDKNMKLSKFGADVLENNRKNKKIFVDKEYENYYPSTYLGFHREV